MLIFVLFSWSFASAEELHVSVVATIKDYVMEIARLFEKNHEGWQVIVDAAPSADIGRQIETGANIDVFIGSDGVTWNKLDKEKFVPDDVVVPLYETDIVIVAAEEDPIVIKEPKDLLTTDLKPVPLMAATTAFGKAVRDYMDDPLEILDSLPADKIVEVKTVREAVDMVKGGKATWTFAFAHDVARSKKLKVLWIASDDDLPGVEFNGAVIPASKHQEMVKQFLDAMQTTIAARIFENAGYRLASVEQLASGAVTEQPAYKGGQEEAETQSQPTLTKAEKREERKEEGKGGKDKDKKKGDKKKKKNNDNND